MQIDRFDVNVRALRRAPSQVDGGCERCLAAAMVRWVWQRVGCRANPMDVLSTAAGTMAARADVLMRARSRRDLVIRAPCVCGGRAPVARTVKANVVLTFVPRSSLRLACEAWTCEMLSLDVWARVSPIERVSVS